MFQHILVPLDGSTRAEHALPVAAHLARTTGARITLLRAVTPPSELLRRTPEDSMLQENLDADRAQAADYLGHITASEELSGVTVMTEVAHGHPAQLILTAADTRTLDAPPIDLIIMCSHGTTGFKRWVLGSVALHIARHSPVPVLVLNERGERLIQLNRNDIHPVRVMVALDGSSLAEATLTPAAELSAALSAPAQGRLHLARVIPWPSEGDVPPTKLVKTAKEQVLSEAKDYLGRVQKRLKEGEVAQLNLFNTSSVAVRSDVADTLIGMAETGAYQEDGGGFNGCDVIALATHGRSGLEHWMIGSVAERLLSATKLPLLIVRPHMSGHQN